MPHLLSNLPIEILAQITCYLRAHDIVWKLGATEDNALLTRLRNGGISHWHDDGQGNVSSKIKFVHRLHKLVTVTLDLKTSSTLRRQYVHSLPSTVRYLSIQGEDLLQLLEAQTDPSTTWDSALQSIGISKTAKPIWIVRESFPSLKLLHLSHDDTFYKWDNEFSRLRFLLGLPASLQDLALPFKLDHYRAFNVFDHLPPNLTKLHIAESDVPSSFPCVDSLTHLELGRNCPHTFLPPNLTHLVLYESSFTAESIPLPSLTSLTILPASCSRTLFQLLECLPSSLTCAKLYYTSDYLSEETLQQLGTLKPLQKLKRLKLLLRCTIDEDMTSELWSQLLRQVPNVEELFIYARNTTAGVEPKHLKMLNPLTLHSLTLPMNDECLDVVDGQSYIQSLLPGLTRLDVDWIREKQIVDISCLPVNLTTLKIRLGVQWSSLVHLPRTLARSAIGEIIVDDWNDEICSAFCDVQTSNPGLSTPYRAAADVLYATSMHIRSDIFLSINLRGEHPKYLIDDHELQTRPGYLQFKTMLVWKTVPTYLPPSLTKLIFSARIPEATMLLTPQLLPNLKILSFPFIFQGLDAFETLLELESSHLGYHARQAACYPPNLTRLTQCGVVNNVTYPASLTYLEISFDCKPVLSPLPSLLTLLIKSLPKNKKDLKWRYEDIPATVTHLELPHSWLRGFEPSEVDTLFQRLPNLRHLRIAGKLISIALLEMIFIPSFPPQAILKCRSLEATWKDLETISSRVACPSALPTARSLHASVFAAIRHAYPRLRTTKLADHISEIPYFTPQVWSFLYQFLSTTTSTLKLPRYPHFPN